jgi:phage terminase large subunit-like protein
VTRKSWKWPEVEANPIAFLATLDVEHQDDVLADIGSTRCRELDYRWFQWAHAGQYPDDRDWHIWLIMAGRGYGKTRAGSEWVSKLARADGSLRFALVGATIEDVRKVMIEGESGLIKVARADETVTWNPGKGELSFTSGALAHVYSAECFEKLRGPEHSHAWCDELGKWNNADATWDNMMLGLRLGDKPRVLVTTTPRSMPLLHRLVAQDKVVLRGGATRDNHNLSPDFVATVEALYGGTRWGRQELEGELLADFEGALWKREVIEACRVSCPAELKRIVIGVDPPASAQGDACGIIVVGLGADDKAYVLADHSVEKASPEIWAQAVASASDEWHADKVVAEVNNGGDMVISTLRAADVMMPVKKVHASRGKAARAEPVSTLYANGKAYHVGAFPELEDQMCGLVVGGAYEGPGRSPDRADALVWAMTELMLGKVAGGPRVSVL